MSRILSASSGIAATVFRTVAITHGDIEDLPLLSRDSVHDAPGRLFCFKLHSGWKSMPTNFVSFLMRQKWHLVWTPGTGFGFKISFTKHHHILWSRACARLFCALGKTSCLHPCPNYHSLRLRFSVMVHPRWLLVWKHRPCLLLIALHQQLFTTA